MQGVCKISLHLNQVACRIILRTVLLQNYLRNGSFDFLHINEISPHLNQVACRIILGTVLLIFCILMKLVHI